MTRSVAEDPQVTLPFKGLGVGCAIAMLAGNAEA
jgi:hypothetical protein